MPTRTLKQPNEKTETTGIWQGGQKRTPLNPHKLVPLCHDIPKARIARNRRLNANERRKVRAEKPDGYKEFAHAGIGTTWWKNRQKESKRSGNKRRALSPEFRVPKGRRKPVSAPRVRVFERCGKKETKRWREEGEWRRSRTYTREGRPEQHAQPFVAKIYTYSPKVGFLRIYR